MEQLDVLDAADVLIWGTETANDRTALEAEALYRRSTPSGRQPGVHRR